MDFPAERMQLTGIQNHRNQWEHSEKCLCGAGSCVITRLNAAPSLSVVLNLQLVPEVCCRPQRPVKEYRLFVIGSVTTECTQQQMRNRKKKNALGVEMSCEQLGSTTEHLRGVIDSLQCF